MNSISHHISLSLQITTVLPEISNTEWCSIWSSLADVLHFRLHFPLRLGEVVPVSLKLEGRIILQTVDWLTPTILAISLDVFWQCFYRVRILLHFLGGLSAIISMIHLLIVKTMNFSKLPSDKCNKKLWHHDKNYDILILIFPYWIWTTINAIQQCCSIKWFSYIC